MPVVLALERLPGAVPHDGHERLVEVALGRKRLEGSHDRRGRLLQRVDLEAVVVEPIDAILVAPAVLAVAEQLLQLGKGRAEVGEKLLNLFAIVHVAARSWLGLRHRPLHMRPAKGAHAFWQAGIVLRYSSY